MQLNNFNYTQTSDEKLRSISCINFKSKLGPILAQWRMSEKLKMIMTLEKNLWMIKNAKNITKTSHEENIVYSSKI